ncbi:MAG: hypothetical protein KDI55_00210 [Anaerolineae bacterium]|nr:hypothetical protein [Anaerolineae bacterium]
MSTERRTMGLEQFTAAIMQRPLPNLYHPMNTGGFSAPYQYPPHQHQQPAQQPQQPATLFSMVMIKEVAMIAMIGMLLGIGWVSRNPTDARDFSREFMGQTIRKITK